MDITTVMLIAVGLSMDAFAVSIASGVMLKRSKVRNALKMALAFGAFQMVMPAAGWFAGDRMRAFISGVDHYVAFGLLAFVGCHMICESIREGRECRKRPDPFETKALLILAVATSIDALAVGISFAFLKVSIAAPVVIIGAVTFAMCFAGVFIGTRFGHFFERRIEIIGGLLLIGIGAKILLQHLV